MPSIDIIIVNWNAGQQLIDCLSSIAQIDKSNFALNRVLVVDNASTDDSVQLAKEAGFPITWICNDANLGFAKACNQGAENSDADYLLFLNPDTRLFESSLAIPIEFMEQAHNSQIGICGIQLVDERNEVMHSCRKFPTFLGMIRERIIKKDTIWDHKSSRYVDQIMGAFFLVRRKLFEDLNGFDERFFVYCEELDFSLRAKQMGYKSYYLAEAKAYHKGGGCSDQVKAKRLFYMLRARSLYVYKHFNVLEATIIVILICTLELIARVVQAILKGSLTQLLETLIAYKLYFQFICRPNRYLVTG